MRKVLFFALLAMFCLQTAPAQTPAPPTAYTAYGYHKVLPGKRDDFLKLAKAWKKIVAAKKKAGMQQDWSLAEVKLVGANDDYNFVTRHSFLGEAQLANFLEKPFLPEGWKSVVTAEEAALVDRAYEIRTLVKQDVWSEVDKTVADDIGKATVAVFNYFKQPAGKTRADHTKVEKDIWKPIHDARIKDGGMKGWILLSQEMPFGAAQPYDMATIDVYTDMKQYLAPWFDAYFKKVHPGKNVDDLLKQTNAATTLLKGEVRLIVDRLDW